jgi:hypothetical protein
MPIRIGNEILIDYLAKWHYHFGNKTAYGRKRNMAGAPVSSGNLVLSLIEAVSTEDDVSLGEIDAFVFCNYANDGWELDDLQSWGPGDYYVQKANRLVVPVPKYTRFTSAQKLLRPSGWIWQLSRLHQVRSARRCPETTCSGPRFSIVSIWLGCTSSCRWSISFVSWRRMPRPTLLAKS